MLFTKLQINAQSHGGRICHLELKLREIKAESESYFRSKWGMLFWGHVGATLTSSGSKRNISSAFHQENLRETLKKPKEVLGGQKCFKV